MSPTVTVEQKKATTETLMAQIAALQAENNKLKAVSEKGLSIRVSSKGGVSVYGLGRFPVSLYRSQWTKLLAAVPSIEEFIKTHAAELKEKEPTAESK